MSGTLYGVGLGPGDPELITRKAARLIAAAPVVAYFSGPGRDSIARSIASELIASKATQLHFEYPTTTGVSRHADGYYAEMEEFYDACAARVREHLDAGRDVVTLAEGDPLFYSTYMYLHERLVGYPRQLVPGVTSVAGATAAAATPLAWHEDVVTIVPGTLPVDELAWRLAQTEAAVIMKLGRTFPAVLQALRQADRLADAVYVERATWDRQRVLPVTQVDPRSVPYFALVVVPGRDRRADAAGRAPRLPVTQEKGVGELHVVGLGPGPQRWLTPEADEILSRVGHVYGYAPYVRRAARPGVVLHPSGNTVEVERAREALAAASAGACVAVVSGGDPGIFAMAAAVFEAAQDPAYSGVRIEVHPGVTAAHAAAALAGAPLGGDFAVVSLSDRLKPWSVIAERLRHLSRADMAVAIYNPRSHERKHQLFDAKAILLEERPAETVVAVARNVGREGESLHVTTLGEFDPGTVDMMCLVIVGSSHTRVSNGRIWTPRFITE